MTEVSTCYNLLCRTTAEGIVAKCPKCGKKMRTPKSVRRLGWVLLVTGLFLVIFMGVITLNLAPLLLHPGEAVAGGSRFTGDAADVGMILTLFFAVIGFGVGTAVNGGYQIATGRRNIPLTILTLVFAAGLYLYARYLTAAL